MLKDSDICCFYQCFRDRPKTDYVLQRFRQVYPTATVHLVSDGGADFTEIAERRGCVCHYEPWNIGYQINTDDVKMNEWFRRFLYVCEACREPWLLILEDDVLVRWPIRTPQHAMTGNHTGPRPLQRSLWSLIHARRPELQNLGYGGGGGTLIDRQLAAESVRSYQRKERFDDWRTAAGGKAHSDLWLTAMMMVMGHQYAPNPDLAECSRHPDWETSSCSIIHQWKVRPPT
jgi:hypothetical protein